jgi:PAS domain S-box-containing protein
MSDIKKTKRQLIQELETGEKKLPGLNPFFPVVRPIHPSVIISSLRTAGLRKLHGRLFPERSEGRFRHVNPAFAAMLGYSSPEDLLSSITDITSQYYVNPEDRRRFMEIIAEHGSVQGFEYKVRRKDGSEIRLSMNARAVRNKAGQVEGYEGLVQNVTERRLADEEIGRYRFMVENAGSEIYLVRRDGVSPM